MSDKAVSSRVWTNEAHLDSGSSPFGSGPTGVVETSFFHTGRLPVSELARGAVSDARHDFCAERG